MFNAPRFFDGAVICLWLFFTLHLLLFAGWKNSPQTPYRLGGVTSSAARLCCVRVLTCSCRARRQSVRVRDSLIVPAEVATSPVRPRLPRVAAPAG